MRMRTLRSLRTRAPRARRREFDVSDATMEPDPGPSPEAVFDRITGPYGRRYVQQPLPGFGFADEET